MTQTINTVSVYRSLLQEDDYEMKEIAVQQLLHNINLHWTDIANDINIMYIYTLSLAKNSSTTITSKTDNSSPFYSPKSISTSTITMKLSSMLCNPESTSISAEHTLISSKSSSTRALKSIFSVANKNLTIPNKPSTKK